MAYNAASVVITTVSHMNPTARVTSLRLYDLLLSTHTP